MKSNYDRSKTILAVKQPENYHLRSADDPLLLKIWRHISIEDEY